MSLDDRPRSQASPGLARRIVRGVANALVPTERTILTREGCFYFGVMAVLLVAGLWQQVNLVLLVATLAAGPFLTSWIGSRPCCGGCRSRAGCRRRTSSPATRSSWIIPRE